jgi:S-DNA-T family DNA segregation ATPase FtsK/SpoIIIE
MTVFADIWLALRVLWLVLLIGTPVLLGVCIIYGAVRFALLPRAAKRNYPAALKARWRWRWLTHNLGLTYEDRHRRAPLQLPVGTAVRVSGVDVGRTKLRHPRAHIRADAYGLVARVKTVPRVGRPDFEDNAEHIANAWRCHRVQVSQPKPGRLIVRGLRMDPLTLPYPEDHAPPGVYTGTNPVRPLRLYLGRDEWAQHRWLHLNGLTGMTIGGLPGFGKTMFLNSVLMQLAGIPAQFVIIDGKGGADLCDWEKRAWIYTGDDLADAAAALEDAHGEMRNRFATVVERTGHRNAWQAGPTGDFPLLVVLIDECHTLYDLEAAKADKEADKHIRACRALTGQLVKKGRGAMVLTILVTQRQTFDSIPTGIRDNCAFGMSFAVRTREAAAVALGDHIRDYPSFCPTSLQSPEYVGVATAALRTGADPFVRLRVPEVTEEAAAARAAETVSLRRDLSQVAVKPETPPADVSAPAIPTQATASEPVSS